MIFWLLRKVKHFPWNFIYFSVYFFARFSLEFKTPFSSHFQNRFYFNKKFTNDLNNFSCVSSNFHHINSKNFLDNFKKFQHLRSHHWYYRSFEGASILLEFSTFLIKSFGDISHNFIKILSYFFLLIFINFLKIQRIILHLRHFQITYCKFFQHFQTFL